MVIQTHHMEMIVDIGMAMAFISSEPILRHNNKEMIHLVIQPVEVGISTDMATPVNNLLRHLRRLRGHRELVLFVKMTVVKCLHNLELTHKNGTWDVVIRCPFLGRMRILELMHMVTLMV
mmetsp:Transcript_17258/g.37244  ORF Transcript_17258/g.37244 Transcript_17258/m.37244 type:complete len:120 (-) Transcript_17258:64-423(-)